MDGPDEGTAILTRSYHSTKRRIAIHNGLVAGSDSGAGLHTERSIEAQLDGMEAVQRWTLHAF